MSAAQSKIENNTVFVVEVLGKKPVYYRDKADMHGDILRNLRITPGDLEKFKHRDIKHPSGVFIQSYLLIGV